MFLARSIPGSSVSFASYLRISVRGEQLCCPSAPTCVPGEGALTAGTEPRKVLLPPRPEDDPRAPWAMSGGMGFGDGGARPTVRAEIPWEPCLARTQS